LRKCASIGLCLYIVYAEASDACNSLDFQLGPTGIGATIPTRQWNIRVTFATSIPFCSPHFVLFIVLGIYVFFYFVHFYILSKTELVTWEWTMF
jgi:hypothetical protein